ncbi:TPA: acetate kinase [Streptococcus agalactiae]
MFPNLLSLISYHEQQIASRRLSHHLGLEQSIVLYAMAKEETISNERCPHPKLINVLEGKLEIILGDQKHILEKDSLISLSPQEIHHLRAIENSKFLQIALD